MVTVYVYVPEGRIGMEILVPEPVVVMLPGERISVHVPVDGNPVNITEPVDTVHVG